MSEIFERYQAPILVCFGIFISLVVVATFCSPLLKHIVECYLITVWSLTSLLLGLEYYRTSRDRNKSS